jgi:hypothetical protein
MTDRMTRERKTVGVMIEMYCRGRHGSRAGQLCVECRELREYADARLDRCPFGPEKPTCSKCPIHCYKPIMRERIREVMRYAGPRMLNKHPILGLRHLIDSRKIAAKKP